MLKVFQNVVDAVQGAFGAKRERDDGDGPPTKRVRGWESKVQKDARKQLEFYFSDSNYRRSHRTPYTYCYYSFAWQLN